MWEHFSPELRQQPARAAAPAASPRAAQPASGLRLLVVEDNRDSAEMMAFMLKLKHHEVRLGYDGEEGLDAARAFQPQVILCDIGLPGINGYEVAQRLRAAPDCNHTRLMALSGYGREEDRRRAQAAGFDYHLTKPVDPEALFALLEALRTDQLAP